MAIEAEQARGKRCLESGGYSGLSGPRWLTASVPEVANALTLDGVVVVAHVVTWDGGGARCNVGRWWRTL